MAQAQRPPFAHESEAELARILDFYGVRWEYEPDTFPILWNLQGDVLESFSPDFYLPDLDLYVELTTLKQRLVRKKNRKLRRLRELYPDIRIKLFYARDFRQLMLKYGKLALADELSGSTGQVPLPYASADDALEGIDRAGRVAARGVEPLAAAVGSVPAQQFTPTSQQVTLTSEEFMPTSEHVTPTLDSASPALTPDSPTVDAAPAGSLRAAERSTRLTAADRRRRRRALKRGGTEAAGAMIAASGDTTE